MTSQSRFVQTGSLVALTGATLVSFAIGPASVMGPTSAMGQETKGKVELRKRLDDLELKGTWYYEDLPAAQEEARRTGKPLFVVLRCPP